MKAAMKALAHRTLLISTVVLSAAAVALGAPQSTNEPTVAPAVSAVPAAVTVANDPLCLRCHWCPFGTDRQGDGNELPTFD